VTGVARRRDPVRGRERALMAATQTLRMVHDPLRTALFVLTILNISRVHQHYPMLARMRPALLLVVASIGYAYLKPRYLSPTNVLKRWPMRLVLILGILACCSAAFGISLGRSAGFFLDSYAKTLAYAFLIAVSIRHVRDLYTFVWAYVISCGILAFFSLFVFGLSKGSGSYVTRLNDLYTYDSNDLGVVMMIGLALTLLLLVVARSGRRWMLLVILVGIGATIARSGSRGGFLGFIATGLAGLLLANSVSVARRVSLLAAAVTSLLLGAPPGYWEQMQTILAPKEDYNYSSIDGRRALMQRGIGYMEEYPLFGLGINNFARAECTISPKIASLRLNGPRRCVVPHNSYIQAGTEIGIPGLLVWVSLLLGGIIAPLKLRRRLPGSWRRGADQERFLYAASTFFPVAMIGFAVTSFFVSFAWMDTIYLMAALLTGLYGSTYVQLHAGDFDGVVTAREGTHSRHVGGWRVARTSRFGTVHRQSTFVTE